MPSRQLGALRKRRHKWVLELRGDAESHGGSRPTLRIEVGSVSQLRSRSAARAEADRQLAIHGLGERLRGRRIRFKDFAQAYRAGVIAIKTPSSRAVLGSYLQRHLVPSLGDSYLDEIGLGRVQPLVAELAAKGLAPATVKGVTDLLRRILVQARGQGYASSVIPPRTLAMPKSIRAEQERRCLSSAEIRQIIAAAPPPWRTFYAICAFTGLRSGEVLGLRHGDVDLDRRLIHVRQAANHGKLQPLKSKNSRADIPLPEPLARLLVEFRAGEQPEASLLFPSPRGGPYWASGVRRHHFSKLLRKLGIPPAGLHAFRHGAATRLFEAGASAPVVRAMLRHGNIATTLRYTHVAAIDQRNASEAASALLDGLSVPSDCGAHISETAEFSRITRSGASTKESEGTNPCA